MKKLYFITISVLFTTHISAQVVNAYARITGIAGQTISISETNQSNDKFEVGEEVIIMQMQDNLIPGSSNSATAGRTNNIRNAGAYEIAEIASIQKNGTNIISITVTEQLNNNYNITQAAVQLISYPQLGTPHYVTQTNITGLPWNGSIGGVVAFKVAGNLTLRHKIHADGLGFRGGAKAEWQSGYWEYLFGWWPIWRDNPDLQPSPGSFFVEETIGTSAEKGEGLATISNNKNRKGRGELVSGGGGGNQNNAGGGGGSNYTSGGTGGKGYQTAPASASGGIGGQPMSAYISASRIFMGGGGGGGQGNDGTATDGAAGGGIVLINANRIMTVGANQNLSISANGKNAANAQQDGAGGGGAGGSILLHANFWEVSAQAPLKIEANGGNGGNVSSPSAHGAGAGGGQGTVIFPFSKPSTGVTVTTKGGTGGCDNTACATRAGNGAGQPGQGIIEFSIGPLPIKLLTFEAQKATTNSVRLYWETASEINNDYFAIERSADMDLWQTILTKDGAGFSTSLLTYELFDDQPLTGINYYRLRQIDFNGETSVSEVQAVDFSEATNGQNPEIFPNPATTVINITHPELYRYKILLYNSDGELLEFYAASYHQLHTIQTANLSSGVYYLMLVDSTSSETHKVIVQK